MKKLFDFTAAQFGLIVAAPVIALLAILIRLESDGAGIFSQDRVVVCSLKSGPP